MFFKEHVSMSVLSLFREMVRLNTENNRSMTMNITTGSGEPKNAPCQPVISFLICETETKNKRAMMCFLIYGNKHHGSYHC